MHSAALLLRIRVISVSTRAAVRSLKADDRQVAEVVERGRSLLDRLGPQVQEHGSDEVSLAFDEARAELDSVASPR